MEGGGYGEKGRKQQTEGKTQPIMDSKGVKREDKNDRMLKGLERGIMSWLLRVCFFVFSDF